jgi:hypothetical protein
MVLNELGKENFKNVRTRISLRANFVFFPLEIEDIKQALEKRNYNINVSPKGIGPIKIDVGVIAEKDNCTVQIEPNLQIIAVDGSSVTNTKDIFNEVGDVFKNVFQIDLPSSTKFYEIIYECLLISNKNPRLVFDNIKEISSLTTKIGSVIGLDVSLFGLRLGSKNIIPNSDNWFDFRIEPVVKKADSQYYISIIYRNPDINKVVDLYDKLEDELLEIVNIIQQ